jgi:glycosyltransferase involved in cell wall biosynthesis
MYRLCVMHPMDPRGSKLGGIETHVRLILSHHPSDFSVLFVGIDECGDLREGEIVELAIGDRSIDFLPVAHIDAQSINLPSRRITQSTTFRFALGALRHLQRIRTAVKGSPASADLQRFEFALLPKLIGLPTVQMIHGEGAKDQKMDSLIKKYWFLHRANEWLAVHLADRIFAVNPNIVERLARLMPRAARKAEVMTVSVDTRRFAPRPFDCADGILRIFFAGRLDEFKDPPLMFTVLAALHARLSGKLEFHYAGTTDPARYREFGGIAPFTTCHGFLTADGIAELAAKCHAGILTSYFEGMPCYLLETLAAGRPFCAIRLRQYDPLIVDGVSGKMVERGEDAALSAARLVDAGVELWDAIRAGRIDPAAVHARIAPYSVDKQMTRLFERHRTLHGPAAPTGRSAAAMTSATRLS